MKASFKKSKSVLFESNQNGGTDNSKYIETLMVVSRLRYMLWG